MEKQKQNLKHGSNFGMNDEKLLQRLICFRDKCSDPLSIHAYMQEHRICIYLLSYWIAKAKLQIQMCQLRGALKSLKFIEKSELEGNLIFSKKNPRQQLLLLQRLVIQKMEKVRRNYSKEKKSIQEYQICCLNNTKTSVSELQLTIQAFAEKNKEAIKHCSYSFNCELNNRKISFKQKSQQRIRTIMPVLFKEIVSVNTDNLKILTGLLKLKFLIKGKQLENEVLGKIRLLGDFSEQELKGFQEISLRQNQIDNYITIYVPNKQESFSSVTNLVIAAALYPFELQECFSNNQLYWNNRRVGIQLFYSNAYGHPGGPIGLRSFIGQFSCNTEKIRRMILDLECDFSFKMNTKAYRIYLNKKEIDQLRLSQPNIMSQTVPTKGFYFVVQQGDFYAERLQSNLDEDQTSEWFDQILQEIQNAGLIQKKTEEKKVIFEKYEIVKNYFHMKIQADQ